MFRGPRITDEMAGRIALLKQVHPGWTAKSVRNAFHEQLREREPALIAAYSGFPSVSAVEKILARFNQWAEGPQDKPWQMSTLEDFPIADPQAIAGVMQAWKYRSEHGQSLTIREAKWAARLCLLEKDAESLASRAAQYARLEQLCEALKRPFDTTALDRFTMGLSNPANDDTALVFLTYQPDGVQQARDLVRGKRKALDFTTAEDQGQEPLVHVSLASRRMFSEKTNDLRPKRSKGEGK